MLKWLVVLACAAGCKERTELMIGVATDLRAPDALDGARLVVSREGVPVHDVTWDITGTSIPENLPGSYGIFSDGDELQVDVSLQGFKNGESIIDRRALVTFIEGRTLFFRMTLVAGCVDRTECSDNQSCIEGTCQDREVDSRTLPEFAENLVTELTCLSGPAYIDTATNLPMTTSADAMACPSDLCSEGTCHVDPSAGGGPVPPRADAGTGDPGTPVDAPSMTCIEGFEPNDTPATAVQTPFGTSAPAFVLDLDLCPQGDVDHIGFMLPSTKSVEIRVNEESPVALGAAILNAGGATIGNATPSGASEQCVCLTNLPASQYFLRLAASGVTNYRIDMKEIAAGQCTNPPTCN